MLSLATAFVLATFFGRLCVARPFNNTTSLRGRSNVVPLSQEAIDEVTEYIQFTRTCYCKPDVLEKWDCGEPCELTGPGVVPLAHGGDHASHPNWHIAYSSRLREIIIVHEGTNRNELKSVAVDLKFAQVPLDSVLFPYADEDSIRVHRGFKAAHSHSAPVILDVVRTALRDGVLVDYTGKREWPRGIVTTGYSLGSALAILDALYLRLNLEHEVGVRAITVGAPMIGNHPFAHWADAILGPTENIRIVNGKDYIPRLPTRFGPRWLQCGTEYHSWHIDGQTHWYNCGVRANYDEDEHCSRGFGVLDMDLEAHHWVGEISMMNACRHNDENNFWSTKNFDPLPDVVHHDDLPH